MPPLGPPPAPPVSHGRLISVHAGADRHGPSVGRLPADGPMFKITIGRRRKPFLAECAQRRATASPAAFGASESWGHGCHVRNRYPGAGRRHRRCAGHGRRHVSSLSVRRSSVLPSEGLVQRVCARRATRCAIGSPLREEGRSRRLTVRAGAVESWAECSSPGKWCLDLGDVASVRGQCPDHGDGDRDHRDGPDRISGSQAKFTMALITATITPTVRAQTAPRNSPMPANRTMMPPMRWIHPQVVASNCRK